MFNEGLNLTDLSVETIKKIEELGGKHKCDSAADMYGVRFHHLFDFENSFGISISKNAHTYGSQDDKWEVAVMNNGKVCCDTPVLSDVAGWLSEEEVIGYAKKISKIDKSVVEQYRRAVELEKMFNQMTKMFYQLQELLPERPYEPGE